MKCMNKLNSKSVVLTILFVSLFIIVIAVVPFILNAIIPKARGNFGTPDTWLSFWATWLAAVFGSSITILGVYFTLRSNSKQFKSNLEYQEEIYSRERTVNLMPHIKISDIGSELDHTVKNDCNVVFNKLDFNKIQGGKNTNAGHLVKSIKLENIGLGSAKNIKIKINDHIGKYSRYDDEDFMLSLGPLKEQNIKLFLYNLRENESYDIFIEYDDIIGRNKYTQKGTFKIIGTDIWTIILKEKTNVTIKSLGNEKSLFAKQGKC